MQKQGRLKNCTNYHEIKLPFFFITQGNPEIKFIDMKLQEE